jgi:hypothetical protein
MDQSKFRFEWEGEELVLYYEHILIARRKGKQWQTFQAFDIVDEDGGVSVKYIPREEQKRRVNACKSKEEAKRLMESWGYVYDKQGSFAEMYHDAVKRGDDPEEIEWLKKQWAEEKEGTKQ